MKNYIQLKREEVAIVGFSGRFPQSENASKLWSNIESGTDCVSEVPESRWDHDKFCSDAKQQGFDINCKWGGFIDGVEEFDPNFFDMPPAVTALHDPNERLFLETVWNLFESSGYTRKIINSKYNSEVGLFLGMTRQEYHYFGLDGFEKAAMSGLSHGAVTNRISHFFNLKGPSVAIDTLCSSSLTAINSACQSLLSGDCKLAVAGGINLSIHPSKYLLLTEGQMLGNDPEIRSFGQGQGYFPSEAIGAVLLKSLSDAQRDGDTIHAVIKASKVSHGGSTNWLFVPNQSAISELISKTLNDAEVSSKSIGYVEVSANGSQIADKAEIDALSHVFKQDVQGVGICPIGTIKSNIGHPEAASGICQLIKVILQLKHKKIPPTIKVKSVNPKFRLAKSPFYLNDELKDWPEYVSEQGESSRRALITSIGAGGSNACLVCEEYKSESVTYTKPTNKLHNIWVLSAQSHTALQSTAKNLRDYLVRQRNSIEPGSVAKFLTSLAHTLQTRREEMAMRVAFIAGNLDISISQLDKVYSDQAESDDIYFGCTRDLSVEQRKKMLGNAGRNVAQHYFDTEQYHALAQHWSQGGSVDWLNFYPNHLTIIQDMPNYPFEKTRYWLQGNGDIFGQTSSNTRSEAVKTAGKICNPEEIEKLVITTLCNEIGLRQEEISLSKTLLELGMNSLTGVRLLRQIEKRFGISINVKELFLASTPEKLVELIQTKVRAGLATSDANRLPRVKLINKLVACYELSEGQKALWLEYTINPKSEAYLLPVALKTDQKICSQILQQVIAELFVLYPTLATTFDKQGGSVVQSISEQIQSLAGKLCVKSLSIEKNVDAIQLLKKKLFSPMDLLHEPLFKVVHLDNGINHFIGLVVHHIIADGLSVAKLLESFTEIYQSMSLKSYPKIEASLYQFDAFVNWEQEYLLSEQAKKDRSYWQNLLEEDVEPINLRDWLSIGYSTVSENSERNLNLVLDIDLSKQLKKIATKQGLNTSIVFLGLYQILLHKYTSEENVVVGMPILGRPCEEFHHSFGNFVNVILVRNDFSPFTRVNDSLNLLKEQVLDSIQHANYPFHYLNSQFINSNRRSLASYIDTTFAFQNFIDDESLSMFAKENRLGLSFVEGISQSSNVHFGLEVIEYSDGFGLKFKFQRDQANIEQVEKLAQSYIYLLQQYVEDQSQLVATLKVINKAEGLTLVERRNVLNSNLMLHEVFSQQSKVNTERTALTFGDSSMSYGELESKANKLAHYLRQKGVTVNTLVGVGIDRSFDLVVSILAILKAGGAYVPLDPRYPESRLSYIISDSGIKHLLLSSNEVVAFQNNNVTNTVVIDDNQLLNEIADLPATAPVLAGDAKCSDLSYVIYTSGTTGYPKGVMQTHENALRLFLSTEDEFHFNEQDVWLLFHSVSFDFSVWELWGALLYGGRLVIPSYDCTRDSEQLVNLCIAQQISVFNQTPSGFMAFAQQAISADAKLPYLRYVIFGGEALQLSSLTPWWQNYGELAPELINMYGITETTVHVTIKRLRQSIGSGSLIGRTISDQSIYILDQALNFVPHGCIGEIYVGGAGLAIGYLNQPELTAQRFISSPFEVGARLYKTGDRARQLPNLEFEYIGRSDNQVKIRGFRIELGEIEQQMLKHELVKSCLAQVYQSEGGADQLAVYVVPTDSSITHKQLRASLRQFASSSMPAHMIPAYFTVVESWPTNANGKVDRTKLPTPQLSLSSDNLIAPSSSNELILVNALKRLLELNEISIDDYFYSIGGDSLRAISWVAECREQGLNFSVSDVFKYPTIKLLAQAIEQQNSEHTELEIVEEFGLITPKEHQHLSHLNLEDAYPLAMLQQGMVLHNLKGEGQGLYHDVFSFKIKAAWDEDKFSRALAKVTIRHASLRSLLNLDGQRPLQLVLKEAMAELDVIDVSSASFEQQQEIITSWIDAEKIADFDLAKPLWRIVVHKLGESEFYYHLSFHHAFWDGWSIASLNTEIWITYGNLLMNKSEQSFDNPLPYRYFVALEQKAQQSETHRDYWLDLVKNTNSSWWTNEPQGKELSRKLEFTKLQAQKVHSLCKAIGIQEKTFFLTLHSVLISLLNNEDHILTSIVSNGRPEVAGSDKTLGLFLNSLPFKVSKFAGTWRELFLAVESQLVKSMEHRLYPLADIQQELGLNLSASLFNYVDFHVYDAVPEIINVVETKQFEKTNFKFSMNCIKDIRRNSYHIALELDCVSFNEKLLEQITLYIENILRIALNEYDSIVIYERLEKSINVLTDIEKHYLLAELNQPTRLYPRDACIHSLFESQVKKFPNEIALVSGEVSITYKQLNEKANQLAYYLLEKKKMASGIFVGICLERSIEMIIGMLAVLKAGGAYVPIDPNYPSDRIAFMVQDAELSIILTQTSLIETFAGFEQELINLDGIVEQEQQAQYICSNYPTSDVSLTSAINSTSLCYLIYTSGSSGKPKGVLTPHKAVVRLVINQGFMTLDSNTTMIHCANISFDAATLEIWGPLLNGGTCVLYTDRLLTPQKLNELIVKEQVSAMFLTSGFFREWVAYANQLEQPIQVLTGGEVFDANAGRHISNHCPNITLIHCYGPTENTTFSTTFTFPEGHDFMTVPIGKRLYSDEVYVLSSEQELVAFGEVGELCLGGDGLACGYLNRPDLTDKSFIKNPFFNKGSDAKSERLYRSGDLVRYQADGNLEFIGRVDDQVKICGFRIELGEIESQFAQLKEVDSVLVVTKPVSKTLQLVAYVKLNKHAKGKSDSQSLSSRIRAAVAQKLPEYMVPKFVVFVDNWSINENGKIDKTKLPEPQSSLSHHAYTAPASEVEQKVTKIWSAVLEIEYAVISADVSFFELGGNSLLALRLNSSIQEAFNLELSAKEIFANPTVQKISSLLERSQVREYLTSKQKDSVVFGEGTL